MMTSEQIAAIIAEIKFQDWQIEFRLDGARPYIQVYARGIDNDTGGHFWWTGRKWLLSFHMVKSEIVQTVFKAVMTAVEHETRETFLYRGAAIFGPHFDVDRLVEIANAKELRT